MGEDSFVAPASRHRKDARPTACRSVAERGTGACRTRVSGNGSPLHLGRRKHTRPGRTERRTATQTRDVSDKGQPRVDLEGYRDDRLGPRLPARGADRRRGCEARRYPRRGDPRAARQGLGWTAITPGSASCRTTSRLPYLRIFDLTNGEYAFLRKDVAIPIGLFFGTMGVCPSGAQQPAGDAAGDVRRQPGHAPARAGLHPVSPRPRSRARSSPAAMRTRPRVTARSASAGIETPIGGTLRFTLEQGRQLPARSPGRRPRCRRGGIAASGTALPGSGLTSTPRRRMPCGR